MRKKSFDLDGKVPVEHDKLKMCKRGDLNPIGAKFIKGWRNAVISGSLVSDFIYRLSNFLVMDAS
jgi:hypothetical protein